MAAYTALFLIKELTSQQKKCVSGPMLTEFTALPVLHCSEAAGLMEWWMVGCPFEESVTASSRSQYLAGLGQVSPEGCECPECTYLLLCLPKLRFMNQEVEMEMALLTVGFPGGSDSKESACNAGDPGSIPGLGRSSGEGNHYPLQYSCLENPMGRGAWWATVHRVTRVKHDYTYSL